MEWIKVEDRMPPEHDSFASKLYGTDKWHKSMYQKCSNIMLVTYEDENGNRGVDTCRTADGEWHMARALNVRAIAWTPFPEPYRDEDKEKECDK